MKFSNKDAEGEERLVALSHIWGMLMRYQGILVICLIPDIYEFEDDAFSFCSFHIYRKQKNNHFILLKIRASIFNLRRELGNHALQDGKTGLLY